MLIIARMLDRACVRLRTWSTGATSSTRLRLEGGGPDGPKKDALEEGKVELAAAVLVGFAGGEEGSELHGRGVRKSIKGSAGACDVDPVVEGKGSTPLPGRSESDMTRRGPEKL